MHRSYNKSVLLTFAVVWRIAPNNVQTHTLTEFE